MATLPDRGVGICADQHPVRAAGAHGLRQTHDPGPQLRLVVRRDRNARRPRCRTAWRRAGPAPLRPGRSTSTALRTCAQRRFRCPGAPRTRPRRRQQPEVRRRRLIPERRSRSTTRRPAPHASTPAPEPPPAALDPLRQHAHTSKVSNSLPTAPTYPITECDVGHTLERPADRPRTSTQRYPLTMPMRSGRPHAPRCLIPSSKRRPPCSCGH